MLKRISLLSFAIAATLFVCAQVTTSNITGTVADVKGEPLAGATITAVHTPSGTKYTTVSKNGGVFNLPGLRTGGPYSITINYVGYRQQVIDNVNLILGEAYNINAEMIPETVDLSTVVVTSTRRKAALDRSGASTNIGQIQLSTLPTISRSITDYTRITPQANGTSFAGRDNRMNNVQVDGANLNNNFGLSSDLLPGSGNPISLDAYQEISVNISPYDVKQSGFTGAGISAITKSGTNKFHGSIYGSYRNQSYNGTRVADTKLPSPAATSNKIYGATIGGPIIKNKLFFFINGEIEKSSTPGVTYAPKGGSGNGTVTNIPTDSLKMLSDYLQSKYGFNPGAYDNFPNFKTDNHKILAKLDWNISTSHKLTLKFSDFKNTGYAQPSASGGINGANSQSSIISYTQSTNPLFSSRFGLNSMGFANSNYSIVDKVRSGAIELNSNFKGRFSNQFIATLTKISSIKGHDGQTFPFADIIGLTSGSKNNYMFFGNEPFNGNNNQVINDVYTVTDNFSYYAGRHTITAGASYEYQKVGNMFMAGSQGYYVYGSLDDFMNDRAPKLFSQTYSLQQGQDAVFSANMKIGQLGIYLQDELNVNPRFKLTYGLRIDRPIYLEEPLENPAISVLQLSDKNVNPAQYTTGKWPFASWYYSPRVGFRWDMNGDKSFILRGGSGLFTGRIPFVYLTNVPSGSGMYQFGALVTSNLSGFLFNPDAHAYNPFYNTSLNPSQFPTKAGTVAPGSFAVTDRRFKFPQVWRSNIAIDQSLGKGWNLTIEALYTKDINDPIMRNANMKAPDSVVNIAPGVVRGRYTSANARKVNTSITNAIVLENTNKGGSFALTALVSKTFSKGFYGSLAYTYTHSVDVSPNPGSQATSTWSGIFTSKTQNDQELAYSQYAVPHRIVATASYRVEYIRHLASTFTIFYEGATQGTYSYIYNGDINNDGNSSDLMYIPKDPSEIKFTSMTVNGTTYTAQQQSDLFFKFIDQDKYLSKHKGQNAERNGALYPWYHRLDFNFQQDIFNNFGKQRNTLQFNLAIVNAHNLLNKDWGIKKQYIVNNPLRVASVTAGTPSYQLATFNGAPITNTYINVNSTTTTWGIQVGLKYIF